MKKIIAVIFYCVTSFAQASIINFEGHGNDFGAPILQDGFSFNISFVGWGVLEDSFSFSPTLVQNGSTRLLGYDGARSVTMSASDSSLFSLSALDAATAFVGNSGSIDIIGLFADSSTITQSISVTDSFTNFNLNAGFTNLVNVSFTGSGSNRGLSLDNLVVNETSKVPAPAAIWLFSTGLVGIVGMRKKRGKLSGNYA